MSCGLVTKEAKHKILARKNCHGHFQRGPLTSDLKMGTHESLLYSHAHFMIIYMQFWGKS